MPLRTPETREEQDAINNKSQDYYDHAFNNLTKGLSSDETKAGSSYNDGLDDHPVSGGDASGKSGDLSGGSSSNTDKTRDREENPMNFTGTQGGGKQAISLKSRLMKKGPLGGIILLLAAGGIGISGLLSPALLLIQMKNVFQNDLNDAGTALSVRTQVMLSKKIGNVKNGFSESSTGKCGIKCKFGTVSDTLVRNLEAKEFKVKTEQKYGRHIITSITFPDGHTATNGKAFNEAMKDPARASSFNKVFNSKTAYFLNSKFGSIIKTKFGLDKAFKLAGETREKFKASFRSAIGLPEVATADPNKPAPTEEESAKSGRFKGVMEKIGGLGGKTGAGVGAVCLAYNSSRAITVGIKTAKMAAYSSYAMTFLNAADKIVAGDNIDPNVVSYLGEILTHTDPNKTNPDGSPNPKYGLSATNSTGYKSSAYGDVSPLPAYAQHDSITTTGAMAAIASLTNGIGSSKVNRDTAHTLCKASSEPATIALQCALAGPGFLACMVVQGITGFAISTAISLALPPLLQLAIDSNSSAPDENTQGVAAGDAIRVGSALILGGAAASYGLKASTKSDIKKYVAYSADIKKQEEAIARYEAKDTPFDIYNQYSFLGNLAQNLNLASYANAPISSNASQLASTIPRALASITTNSFADTTMSQNDNKAEQYGLCEDTSLIAIDIHGDANCNASFTMSESEMNADNEAVTNWMIDNKNIDPDTGASIPGSDYKLYLDNCANRVEPLGETSKSIEEGNPGDYEWYIGANCQEVSDRLSNFRVYKADISVNTTLDHEEEPDSALPATDTPTNNGATSGPVNPNGWSFPTTAGAQLSDKGAFGPRDGGFHTGIDLAVPSGSPFYATRDGTILVREYDIRSIAGGAWCKVIPSESFMQKDIWITHDVDGVKYTSVYAHMSSYAKKTGDVVKAGELIGYTGGSGCSTGPHVHFEIWQGNANPSVPGPGMQDPWPLINK
jgi:hypothetical protein